MDPHFFECSQLQSYSQDCCGQKKIAVSICGISVCWDDYAQKKAGITDDRYESDLVKKHRKVEKEELWWGWVAKPLAVVQQQAGR